MWVFKYKFDDQGWLVKFKARLVARGDLQHTGMDTFAATLAARLFRFLTAINAAFDLETRQYDAVNAFANSAINEPTFCKAPSGWIGNSNILLLLQQALYGLKQSPALWYGELSHTFIDLELKPISGIECVYANTYMIVFFFVDDICVLYNKRHTAQVDAFEASLFTTYEMESSVKLSGFLASVSLVIAHLVNRGFVKTVTLTSLRPSSRYPVTKQELLLYLLKTSQHF